MIEANKIDVNVHPTKSEVHFLDEEEIVQLVCDKLQSVLVSGSASRSYTIQVRLFALDRILLLLSVLQY